jgi:non-heme chloroperoxidase
MKHAVYILFISAFFVSFPGIGQYKKVNVDGGELSYVDKGSGEPIIFLHGALEDYRVWEPQIDRFSEHFRVIAYSRRYSWPNRNTVEVENYSPATETADLLKLISALNVGRVHLVGHSYGALIALYTYIHYPQYVKSLTLSEPPIANWLPGLAGGKQRHDELFNNLWKPVKQAFQNNDTAAALRHTLTYFSGSDAGNDLPADVISTLKANIGDWKAISFSGDAFLTFDKQAVRNIKIPTFIVTAGKTIPMLQLTNEELIRLLPHAQKFHLEDATHDLWFTHAEQAGNALLKFMLSINGKTK